MADFHFGVEAFGDAIVSGEAPQGADFLPQGVPGIAQLDGRSESGLAQFGYGLQQPENQFPAALGGPVFFRQQRTEFLFGAVDQFQCRTLALSSAEPP